MSDPTIVTCAITGSAPVSARNPVPVTPAEIAESALEAWRAGAAIVHIHVRDPETGAPSGELRLYEDVVNRIKRAGSDVVINLTTGYGGRFIPGKADPLVPTSDSTLRTPEHRVEHIRRLRPEICSLDMGSLNFGNSIFVNIPEHIEAIAAAAVSVGTVTELEVFEPGHLRLARDLQSKSKLASPGYFQFCLGVVWGSPADTRTMQFFRDQLPPDAAWSAFGVAQSQFPMAAQAVLLNGNVRVGMEDNLFLSRGVPTPSNAALVKKAVELIEQLGGSAATPAQARQRLGLLS